MEPAAEQGDPVADRESALYLEYVAELRKVPTLTLQDEVVVSPRPTLPADFRQGQRPNARREARDDPDRLREQQASEIEALYVEYASGAVAAKKKKRRARAQSVSTERKPARKRAKNGRPRRKT